MSHPSEHPLAEFTLALCDQIRTDLADCAVVSYGTGEVSLSSIAAYTTIVITPAHRIAARRGGDWRIGIFVGDGRAAVNRRDQNGLSSQLALEYADPEFLPKLYELVRSDELYQ